MNKGKQNNHTIIEHLLKGHQSFAAWRVPGERVFHIVKQSTDNIKLLDDIDKLQGKQGFVIAPFKVDASHPIVLIEPHSGNDIITLCNNEKPDFEAAKELSNDIPDQCLCSESYSDRFDIFIDALQKKEFDKLVLSRSATSYYNDTISPADIFYKACSKYIHSFIYLCYTPQTGIWIGSSPEILLSGGSRQWSTVALAGTQALQEGKLPEEWNEKNRKEQSFVASYIRRILILNDIIYLEQGPYPAYAGSLSHLKTEFHFTLHDTSEVCKMLKMLHPTPAVCGLPKEKAYQFIADNEGYDRSYYSGFIGWFDTTEHTDLYVNLRCMNINKNNITLYAGGGLLASSTKEEEWQETENKLQTMRRLINPKL